MAKRKSKAELQDKYRSCISHAKRWRRQEMYDDLWRRMNDLYRGRHFPAGLSLDDSIVVNVAFATINVIGPAVAVNYPKTVVTAVHPEDEDKAVILEEVVNYWWRKYEILPEFQLAVKDYLIYGFGWIKTGYRFVEREVEKTDDEYAADLKSAQDEVGQYAADNPLDFATPNEAEVAASVPRTRMVIEHDAPFVERVSVHDVFVDPEATSMRDARWIAQRVVKTKDELLDQYPKAKSVVEKAQPDSVATEAYFTNNPWVDLDAPEEDAAERYSVWEYYNLTERTMCVFPDVGDGYFVEPTPMPYDFGHPFVMLRNYDIPDVFYPMGELEALEPLQHELNMTRTSMFNDRKQYRRAWVYRPEAFGPLGRAALESDEDNRLIPVEGNLPIDDAIKPLPAQQVNPQLYQDSTIIEGDITNVTGINDYMRGALPEIRRTATEAAIIQDVANARAADKLAKVEKAIGEISRRLTTLAQQYMTEQQVARVVSVATPRPVWFKFDPEDIQGEFDFSVEGGSTQPLNEGLRRQTAIDMLQALAPYGAPDVGLINMQAVLAQALRDGFGVKDVSKFLGQPQAPAPPPPQMPMDPSQMDPQMMAAAMVQPPTATPTPMDIQMAAGKGTESMTDPMTAQLAGQMGLDL